MRLKGAWPSGLTSTETRKGLFQLVASNRIVGMPLTTEKRFGSCSEKCADTSVWPSVSIWTKTGATGALVSCTW